jgi:hypothetical protein
MTERASAVCGDYLLTAASGFHPVHLTRAGLRTCKDLRSEFRGTENIFH